MKLCMIILVIAILISGCSNYQEVSGNTKNWSVKVTEIPPQENTEMVQTTIQYIGKEDPINDFKFKLVSDAISVSGTDSAPSLPFNTTISTNPKTSDPFSKPIKLTIEWNNHIEEMTLQQ